MELAARAHAGSGRDDVLLPAGHSALAARAAQTRLAGALAAQDAAEAQRRADAWKPGQPLDLWPRRPAGQRAHHRLRHQRNSARNVRPKNSGIRP